MVSEIGSAKYMPFTPKNFGKVIESGIIKTAFLSIAINSDIFA